MSSAVENNRFDATDVGEVQDIALLIFKAEQNGACFPSTRGMS